MMTVQDLFKTIIIKNVTTPNTITIQEQLLSFTFAIYFNNNDDNNSNNNNYYYYYIIWEY